MSDKRNDEVLEGMRARWLDDRGCAEADVTFDDDDGKEYVLVDFEDGTPGEDGYDAGERREYLPEFKLEDAPEGGNQKD